jgi:hypothetical protein
MNPPSDVHMLYPLFAMFALVAGVLGYMAVLRFGAVSKGEMDPRFYRLYQGNEEPDHMRQVTRHFINLFEVPTLFYVVVLTTYVTHQVSPWMIGCAWAYVAMRYVHSAVHLGSNDVLTRFRVFILGNLVLAVLWGSLFVKLVTSA